MGVTVVGAPARHTRLAQRNAWRTALVLANFLLACQVIAACALALPLFLADIQRFWLFHPAAYVLGYGLWVLAASALLVLVQMRRHVRAVQTAGGAEAVPPGSAAARRLGAASD